MPSTTATTASTMASATEAEAASTTIPVTTTATDASPPPSSSKKGNSTHHDESEADFEHPGLHHLSHARRRHPGRYRLPTHAKAHTRASPEANPSRPKRIHQPFSRRSRRETPLDQGSDPHLHRLPVLAASQ